MPKLSSLLLCSLLLSLFGGAAGIQCYACTPLSKAAMTPIINLAFPYVNVGPNALSGIQYNSTGCKNPTSGIKTVSCKTSCLSFYFNVTDREVPPETTYTALVRGCADKMLIGAKVHQTPGCCGRFTITQSVKVPHFGTGVVCPCEGKDRCNTKPQAQMLLTGALQSCANPCAPNPCQNGLKCFDPTGVDYRCGGNNKPGINGTQAPFTLAPTGKTTPTVKTTTGSTMKPTTTVKGGGTTTTVSGTSGTGSTTTTKGKGTASASTTTITATTTAAAPTLNPLSLGLFLTLLAALLL